jgi:hypothetical protein
VELDVDAALHESFDVRENLRAADAFGERVERQVRDASHVRSSERDRRVTSS